MTDKDYEPKGRGYYPRAADDPEVGPERLPDPGKPLVITLTTDADGFSNVRYTTSPEYAISVLREIADSIEKEALSSVHEPIK